MVKKTLFECITTLANRNTDQAKEMLRLCDHNMMKYIELEVALKEGQIPFVPNNVETVKEFLSKPIKSTDKEFKKHFLIK